jgi:hypothetical protein
MEALKKATKISVRIGSGSIEIQIDHLPVGNQKHYGFRQLAV